MGAAGFPSRAEAIEGLLGQNLLPTQLVHRRHKAVFDGAFFANPSRSFAQEWDGGGLGNRHVDVDRLAQELRTSPRPDARSYPLLRAAWLGAQAYGDPANACRRCLWAPDDRRPQYGAGAVSRVRTLATVVQRGPSPKQEPAGSTIPTRIWRSPRKYEPRWTWATGVVRFRSEGPLPQTAWSIPTWRNPPRSSTGG